MTERGKLPIVNKKTFFSFVRKGNAPCVRFAGVLLKCVPPLPIPNREVKALKPDDTWDLASPGK